MFKPDRTFKRVSKQYRSCAYLYTDGVALVEHRKVKSGQYETEIEIVHIWHTELKFWSRNNGYSGGIKRIVVHDPSELLSGLEKIDVYFHNASKAAEDANIEFWGITCTAPNGHTWQRNACNLISDNFSIQPNPQDRFSYSNVADTVDEWESSTNIEIHS